MAGWNKWRGYSNWLCRDGKLFSHYYSSTVLFEQNINFKFRLIYKIRSIKTKISLLIISLGTISYRSAPIKKAYIFH